MLIEYPMMSDYSIILYNDRRLFLTHGHIYNEKNLPNLSENDVLIHGHTHIPVAKKQNNIFILNPGSISLPRENIPNSYAVLQDDLFQIKDLEGNVIKEIKFKKIIPQDILVLFSYFFRKKLNLSFCVVAIDTFRL